MLRSGVKTFRKSPDQIRETESEKELEGTNKDTLTLRWKQMKMSLLDIAWMKVDNLKCKAKVRKVTYRILDE